ncbi:MAG: adenosylmethionine--8-amino-7-oxononanoate transaminase [Pseudomonadota bacterium]
MTLSADSDLRAQLVALDKRHVWHPYTAMDRYIRETDPLVVHCALGARLFDLDGRSYLDGNASWWVALLGHNHPRLLRCLTEQAARMTHVALAGITHEPAARLASELCAVAPTGLSRVFFSDDGSTAVEVAIKMSLQYWAQNARPERKRFIALSDAFHGDTLGVTALGGVEVFRRPFAGSLLDCVHAPAERDGYSKAFEVIEQLVRDGSDTIAACIVEPIVQGAGGMRIYQVEYLQRLRELLTRYDVFLIADEVFTGYGRTGPMWACEHAGISPDILCTAKGFTSGILPMAATLATERVFDGFRGEDSRALYYGHTYSGHPLGAAIAREVLAIYKHEQVLEKIPAKAAKITAAFDAMRALPGVVNSRSLGMIGALDLRTESEHGGYLDRAGWRVSEEARRLGAYLRPLGNVVYVTPPLNIEDTDLDDLLAIVERSVSAAYSG